MPGVTDVARAKEIIGKTAQLEFKLVEAGPAAKEDLLKQYNGNAAGRPGDPAGLGRRRRRRGGVVLRRQEDRAGHRPGPARRQAGARREQPAGGALRAEAGRRAEVRQALGREHRPLPGDRPRQPVVSAPQPRRAHHRPGAHQRRLHRRDRQRPVADAALRRAAGEPDLRSRRTSSARRSAPTRSAPACIARRWSACC